MVSPNLLGGLVYIAGIILPGLGIGEAIAVWKPQDSLVERFAKTLGLGLSIDAILLFLSTSGITVFGVRLIGVSIGTVYALSIGGLILIVASVAVRRAFRFPVRPTRIDLGVLLLMLIQTYMLFLYFQRFPIFPEYPSGDFLQYLHIAEDLASGAVTSGTTSILYFGIHYQLAAAITAIGGEPLVTIRWTMAALAVLSTPIWFLAAKKLFGKTKVSLIIVTIYSLTATIWFGTIFNAGLYSNFYGILSTIFFLSIICEVQAQEGRSRWWIPFVLSLGNLYLSHYSSLTVLPALVAVPIIARFLSPDQFKRYAAAATVPFLPALIIVPLYPGLVTSLLNIATQAGSGQALVGSTPLATALSSFPVIGFIATEVTDDIATAALFLFFLLYFYFLRNSREPRMFIAPIWFFSLVVAAPFNTTAWRFSFEAIVPLTLMAGYSIATLIPERVSQKKVRKTGKRWGQSVVLAVIMILLAPVMIGSWGQNLVQTATSDTQSQALIQNEVYDAILWLQNHTSTNSTYLSVSDWRFTYTNYMINRHAFYRYTNSPSQGIEFAIAVGANYIIVTNYVTENIPPVAQYFPWNTFPGGSNMTLVYDNPDVRIFHVG
jgi:hypothetical protein